MPLGFSPNTLTQANIEAADMSRLYREACEDFGMDSEYADGMYWAMVRCNERAETIMRAVKEENPNLAFQVGGI